MAKKGSLTQGVEGKLVEFAEDLGKILGAAQRKADSWLGQRKEVAKQLANIRDTATGLLGQLGIAEPAKRGRKPGRPAAVAPTSQTPKPRGRRKMSAKARKAISDAQKRRWAKQKGAAKGAKG